MFDNFAPYSHQNDLITLYRDEIMYNVKEEDINVEIN